MDPNKNRLEIRLDPDSLELLNSLIARTSLTKTSLIKKALIVYASALKKGHIYTVKLEGTAIKEEKPQIEEATNNNWQEEYDKTMKELEETRPIEENKEDKLPF